MDGELYWAAGFWDGEGCVTTSKPQKALVPRSVAEIAQVDPEVLYRFAKAVAMGNVLGPYKQKNPKARDYYCWRVEGIPNIVKLMNLIYDKAGKVKKDQFDYALERRAEWESDPRCKLGHELSISASLRYYCHTCSAKNGRGNAKPISTHKICGWCKEDKKYEEFNRHSGRLDGRQTVCRACMKTYRAGKVR